MSQQSTKKRNSWVQLKIHDFLKWTKSLMRAWAQGQLNNTNHNNITLPCKVTRSYAAKTLHRHVMKMPGRDGAHCSRTSSFTNRNCRDGTNGRKMRENGSACNGYLHSASSIWSDSHQCCVPFAAYHLRRAFGWERCARQSTERVAARVAVLRFGKPSAHGGLECIARFRDVVRHKSACGTGYLCKSSALDSSTTVAPAAATTHTNRVRAVFTATITTAIVTSWRCRRVQQLVSQKRDAHIEIVALLKVDCTVSSSRSARKPVSAVGWWVPQAPTT
jgi:hypothetical protein